MRNFFVVLKFELMNFMKNKAFVISTLIICLLLAGGLSIPTIKDAFFSGTPDGDLDPGNINQRTFGFINKSGATLDTEILINNFAIGELVEFDNQAEMERLIRAREIESGYVIQSPTSYQRIVENNEMFNHDSYFFEQAMIKTYRVSGFEARGIDFNNIQDLISVHIESDTKILGTDSAANYLYTYILVFGLYFVVIMYGQIVATSVASEKSNRAMEVLVTSTDSKNLIFGKVLGGALAGSIQLGLIIITGFLAYRLNSTAWNGELDFIFNIPARVLMTFSIFGILGYLFYLFIFGALGALVSRTEDVSASATPITIIFVAVFAVAVTGMQNTQGLLIRIASYIPLSSFMAMFVRVSMGTVSNIEVIISLTILALTTVFTGVLAASIYRLGTLMYGNPVKINQAIKLLMEK